MAAIHSNDLCERHHQVSGLADYQLAYWTSLHCFDCCYYSKPCHLDLDYFLHFDFRLLAMWYNKDYLLHPYRLKNVCCSDSEDEHYFDHSGERIVEGTMQTLLWKDLASSQSREIVQNSGSSSSPNDLRNYLQIFLQRSSTLSPSNSAQSEHRRHDSSMKQGPECTNTTLDCASIRFDFGGQDDELPCLVDGPWRSIDFCFRSSRGWAQLARQNSSWLSQSAWWTSWGWPLCLAQWRRGCSSSCHSRDRYHFASWLGLSARW